MANQTLREAIEELEYSCRFCGGSSELKLAEELAAILARFPKPSGPTVRVRMAVAASLNDSACAMCYGSGKGADEAAVDELVDSGDTAGMRISFVEVDVPIHNDEQVALQGEVTP